MDNLIIELYANYRKDPDSFYLNEEIWLELAKQENTSVTQVFDLFFSRLAYLYSTGCIDYYFGDIIANEAFSHWVISFDENHKNTGFPPKFWQVYLAFDDGEYHRKDDKSDDPVVEHTNPQIFDFLKEHNIKN